MGLGVRKGFLSVTGNRVVKVRSAHWLLERLPELGIGIDNVTRQIENEGVEKIDKPFGKLMETLAQRSLRHRTKES